MLQTFSQGAGAAVQGSTQSGHNADGWLGFDSPENTIWRARYFRDLMLLDTVLHLFFTFVDFRPSPDHHPERGGRPGGHFYHCADCGLCGN